LTEHSGFGQPISLPAFTDKIIAYGFNIGTYDEVKNGTDTEDLQVAFKNILMPPVNSEVDAAKPELLDDLLDME